MNICLCMLKSAPADFSPKKFLWNTDRESLRQWQVAMWICVELSKRVVDWMGSTLEWACMWWYSGITSVGDWAKTSDKLLWCQMGLMDSYGPGGSARHYGNRQQHYYSWGMYWGRNRMKVSQLGKDLKVRLSHPLMVEEGDLYRRLTALEPHTYSVSGSSQCT